jgi:hypothetical protein
VPQSTPQAAAEATNVGQQAACKRLWRWPELSDPCAILIVGGAAAVCRLLRGNSTRKNAASRSAAQPVSFINQPDLSAAAWPGSYRKVQVRLFDRCGAQIRKGVAEK